MRCECCHEEVEITYDGCCEDCVCHAYEKVENCNPQNILFCWECGTSDEYDMYADEDEIFCKSCILSFHKVERI